MLLSQGPTHPFTDLLNLNSTPTMGGNLLVDVFSDTFTPASTDESEENFFRWSHTLGFREMEDIPVC